MTEANMPAQGIQLSEAVDLSEAQVDADNRIIRGVILIKAGRSSNRREYPAHVLEGAVTVFEGAKAYADHPTKPGTPRTIRDTTGWYTNVRYENSALRADRHFTRNAAGLDVWAIAHDIAEHRAPVGLAGLSINAVGTGKVVRDNGEDIVEVQSITAAQSVDDVSQPAAGGAYQLVAGGDGTLTGDYLAVISYEQWLEARPEFVDKLKREWKAVRLEDETKRVLAESDLKVKAAEAKAGELETDLQTARAEIAKLTEARDAALVEVQRETRKRLVAETLVAVKLPASWKDELRGRLMEAAPDTWAGIIEAEINKAKHTGAMPKVPVTGTPMREAVTPDIQGGGGSAPRDLTPREYENFDQWQQRLAKRSV